MHRVEMMRYAFHGGFLRTKVTLLRNFKFRNRRLLKTNKQKTTGRFSRSIQLVPSLVEQYHICIIILYCFFIDSIIIIIIIMVAVRVSFSSSSFPAKWLLWSRRGPCVWYTSMHTRRYHGEEKKLDTRRSICRSEPKKVYNPQNTDQPMVLPNASFSAHETVRVQLEALKDCNEPWANHGIQLAYEFGYDIGGLDPSMYFGYPKDLYHQDHFMGQFGNQFPEMLNSSSFEILGEEAGEDGAWTVDARVIGGDGSSEKCVRFHLKKKQVGPKKGAFMTYMIETL